MVQVETQKNSNPRSNSRAVISACLRGALAFTLAAAVVTLSACGGGGDTKGTVEPPLAVVSQVNISAGTSTLSPPQTLQLGAVARTSAGVSVPSATFTWSSSANGVASVNSSGLVTAVAPGTATISAATTGATGTVTLTVVAAGGTVATVNVALSDTTIQIGGLSQATVSARDANNQVIAVGTRPLVWSSTNTSIATVSDGLVTAVGIGTAQIRATVTEGSNQIVGSVTLTSIANSDAQQSQDVSMPGLTFTPADVVVKVNGTVRFIFPVMEHNVFWRPTVPGQPADINTTANVVVTRTFPTVGVYPYVCTLHDGMKGTIVVSP